MSDPMTDDRIARIRKRAEAATPGPWRMVHDATEVSVESAPLGRFVCHLNDNMTAYWADAALIAHARCDIPDLLAHIDRLATERDRLAAIVGVECPIGDLSIVESLRVTAAHAGQHAEEMERERDEARRRSLRWKAAAKAIRDERESLLWAFTQAQTAAIGEAEAAEAARAALAEMRERMGYFVRYWWEQHKPDERDLEMARARLDDPEIKLILAQIAARQPEQGRDWPSPGWTATLEDRDGVIMPPEVAARQPEAGEMGEERG